MKLKEAREHFSKPRPPAPVEKPVAGNRATLTVDGESFKLGDFDLKVKTSTAIPPGTAILAGEREAVVVTGIGKTKPPFSPEMFEAPGSVSPPEHPACRCAVDGLDLPTLAEVAKRLRGDLPACRVCGGSGFLELASGHRIECPHCDAMGFEKEI